MAKKKKKKEIKDAELQPLVEDSNDNPPVLLPLLGELVAGILAGLCVFTIFVTLRITEVVHWKFWWICSPLWALLAVLVLLTQSKKLTTHVPLIGRLVWIICLLAIAAFLIILTFHLEQKLDSTFQWMFFPLWGLFGSCLLLGCSGIIVSLCVTSDEEKKRKYLLAGLGMLGFDLIFFPFLLLMQLKLIDKASFGWSMVFVPLWIADGFFLCSAFILLLFTIGSRDSAIFSISQVFTFICVLPAAALFKVLLVLALDETVEISYFVIMVPLLVMELLVFSCALNVRLTTK